MSDYEGYLRDLENQIHRRRLLKEAQRPDSAHAVRYQDDVDTLTDAHAHFEELVPRLQELDQEITDAYSELEDTIRWGERGSQPWPLVAGWCGGLGGAGLLLSVGLGLSWPVTVLAVLLLAAAVGCVAMKIRTERGLTDGVRAAQDRLRELVEERGDLLNGVDIA